MPYPRPTTRKPPRLKKQGPQVPSTHKQTFAPPKGVIRPQAPPPPKGVSRPVTPVAPTQAPPPPPSGGTAPPPEGSRGYATRTAAGTAYSSAVSGYKSALVQAALSLGSPEILQALRNNPDYAEYAGVIDQGMVNPESTMAQLQKQEEGGLKEVDVGRNANNTFFSGFRLQDRGKVTDEYNSRRTGAVNEYVSGAQADATRGLAGALNDYNRAMNEALGYDIEDQLAAEPEPEAAPEPVPTAATHGAPPKGVDRSRSQAAAARARAEAAAREAEQRARARARLRGRR